MSMSTHVVGFKPADEKWKKMKKVYDSCKNAKIDVPTEVWDFFNNENPDNAGVRVELELSEYECCSKYSGESQNGFEINIKELPEDVTVIRFYNSY